MRLRIESDGSRRGTRVMVGEGEAAEVLEGVSKVTWEYSQDEEFVTATIKVSEVGLSVKGDCSKDVL